MRDRRRGAGDQRFPGDGRPAGAVRPGRVGPDRVAGAEGDRRRRGPAAAQGHRRGEQGAASRVGARRRPARRPPVRVADRKLEGVTCIRLDATVVTAHTDKELAEPNFKGYGHHPLLAACDNTGEPLAWMLRPGSAGSNTAADHLRLLARGGRGAAARPAPRLMITCDGAGASHALVKELDRLARPARLPARLLRRLGAGRPGAGRDRPGPRDRLGSRDRRERPGPRAPRRRRLREPALRPPRACWIEEAHVTELTGLLREGPGRRPAQRLAEDDAGLRPPRAAHPGAQLSLFETADGWRYSLWATNLPADTRGWRGQCAYADAAHRVHARVEDVIRTGKDTGLGHFPYVD